MIDFKAYFSESEEQDDVRETLNRLPKRHRVLVAGYKFHFEPNNTLKTDNKSVGEIDEEKKKITVASPWNYGRQFTLLHEIAHLVWKYLVSEDLRSKWKKAYKSASPKQSQGMEELFCMAYANHYAKNKIQIHNHSEWEKFIRELPK